MTIGREEWIAEAERIGRRLLQAAEHEDGLLCWRTGPAGERTRSESLYSGAAGIALFFARLAEMTGRERYLDAATAAMRWTEASLRRNPGLGHGFYTGRLGVAYAWLQLSRVTGRKYDAAVSALTRDALDARRSHTADLLAGVAGTLLGLLHVHAATGDPALLDRIAGLAGELIARAWPARAGLYWDRKAQQVRGLCGLSHGASGVGFVLAELARYTSNPAFAALAREAFAYERDQFDVSTGNWIDWRCSFQRAEEFSNLEAAYLRGDLSPFRRRGDMNAWCHGAAGIGLARLRAWELLGDDVDRQELELALRRVVRDFTDNAPTASATLCHGQFGNAALLWAAGHDDALVHRVVRQVIETARTRGGYASGFPGGRAEDASLLMGSSGIGYFLLQLAAGERRDPLLLPVVPPAEPVRAQGVLAITAEEAQSQIAAKRGGTGATGEKRWFLAEAASLALLAVRSAVHAAHADPILASSPLRLSDDAAILAMPDGTTVLLFATIDGSEEVRLHPLAAAVLAQFERPCRVEEAVSRLADLVDGSDAAIAAAAAAQIREAFLQSILVPA